MFRVVVQGPGPGPRYGHVMALVGQRFLLAIGGNDGRSPPLCLRWFLYCTHVLDMFSFSCGIKMVYIFACREETVG